MYCLSDWFKREESALNYLKDGGIPVFWGNSETCKEKIIEFIHNPHTRCSGEGNQFNTLQ
jgi:hypothetical protein